MKQHELAPPRGAHHRKKRVGRGLASGHGRLNAPRKKGRPGFEGGQLPLYRRLVARRGFRNRFRVEYAVVNVSQLNTFEANSVVTPEVLLRTGMVRSPKKPIKILGEGKLTKPLTVKVHGFSQSATAKIEDAGGQVEEVEKK